MAFSFLRSAGGTLQLRRPSASPAVRTADVLGERRALAEWYQALFAFNGSQYAVPFTSSAYGHGALMSTCGPVHAVIDRRVSIMGEARPMFQRLQKGRPGEFFSSRELEILNRPWNGGTWRQLVAIAESDVASGGNSYWVRAGAELVRLNPEWVTIVTTEYEIDGEEVGYRLLGYVVERPGHRAIPLPPEQVAHYKPGAPVSEPFRGQSWLAAVCSDAGSDVELTRYKGNYLKNGAMPSLAVTYEPTISMDQIEQFVGLFKDKFVGSMNAGKVMHFMGGRDIKTVGATLDELAFKAVQGAGETRVAAAAGVPAVVAGFSEGMQGSSLNAGNYVATRRLFGDAKIRPLLGSFCDAFSTLVGLPPGSAARLWYDDSGVSFFQEDVADEANIRLLKMQAIRQGIETGFEPDAVIDAVENGNISGLRGQHTGLVSVQLQEPGANDVPPASEPNAGAQNDQPSD